MGVGAKTLAGGRRKKLCTWPGHIAGLKLLESSRARMPYSHVKAAGVGLKNSSKMRPVLVRQASGHTGMEKECFPNPFPPSLLPLLYKSSHLASLMFSLHLSLELEFLKVTSSSTHCSGHPLALDPRRPTIAVLNHLPFPGITRTQTVHTKKGNAHFIAGNH